MRRSAGLTLRLAAPALGDLDAAAAYILSAPGTEARGRAPIWGECATQRSDNCIEVVETTPATMTIRPPGGSSRVVALNDDGEISSMLAGFDRAYVDISGLPHHVWAALIRVGFTCLERLHAVYAEPSAYKRHPNPTSKAEFDLSDGFRGIEPLPGLAKLRGPADETKAVFVAMMGFEGRRARHVALALDPVPPVYAVIGLPGFRLEYPQVTHTSGEEFLSEHRAHHNIRYASASCPFEAFDVLGDIRRDCQDGYMYLAPIGTKPHALGAICYALKNRGTTEIMYDHPLRKPGRTAGIGTVHIYTLKPSYVCP